MDESFYKKERIRAQKISSGISGFGNESSHDHRHHHHHQSTHSKFLPSFVPRSQSASSLLENRLGAGGSISLLRGDEEEHANSKPDARESCRSSHEGEGEFCSPSTSDASSWKTFSGSSGVESASTSGRSENSTCGNVSTKEESPTHLSSFPKTAQILDMDSVASGLENNRTSSLQRLPPPPPTAVYKGVKPQAPRVQSKLPPKSVRNDHGNAPDLIFI